MKTIKMTCGWRRMGKDLSRSRKGHEKAKFKLSSDVVIQFLGTAFWIKGRIHIKATCTYTPWLPSR